MLRSPALFFLFAFLAGCGASQQTSTPPASQTAGERAPTVLLVSLDGFRWDYPDRYATPNLDRIARQGVRAKHLWPVFPTKTFPNHYTQVTGLYPAHHGIVSNTMYDPEMDASFSLGDTAAVRDARWWGGEPLWVTAEKQGQTAATYFWPGSEVAPGGVRPTYWKPYDGRVPGAERVDQVLRWLDQPPGTRPTFLTLYFSAVDGAGHRFGPDAPETATAVRKVDGHLGRLLDGLEARGLRDKVNLIVTSDHGMAATSPQRVIFLDDYLDLEGVQVVDLSPVAMLRPTPGTAADSLYAALKGAHPHLSVYRKGALPERLHFDGHLRIPPLLGLADEGWSIATRDLFEEHSGRFQGGAHGYDPQLASMHGIFYAAGPAFAAQPAASAFASIDLYLLITGILHLKPAPNDGDPAAAQRIRTPQLVTP